MKIMNTTLLIIIKGDKLLLGQKKSGFGKGKINGVGGKQDAGETIEQAMLRETLEEFNIVPINYSLRGILDYDELYKGERTIIRTHIFSASDYQGTPTETDEMIPVWIDKNNIPYQKMFGDDILWYEQFLNGKNFFGKVLFDDDFNIVSHDIQFFDHEIKL